MKGKHIFDGLIIVICILVVVLAVREVFFQSAPELTTVTECLLVSGFSTGVAQTPVTTLAGVDAWRESGEKILSEGVNVGFEYFDDEAGARRMVSFHVWEGKVYVFVYKHREDPGRINPGEPLGTWHGDCLLQLT